MANSEKGIRCALCGNYYEPSEEQVSAHIGIQLKDDTDVRISEYMAHLPKGCVIAAAVCPECTEKIRGMEQEDMQILTESIFVPDETHNDGQEA